MTTPNPRVKFTYRDYVNAPEDKRYELLDGDLVVVPPPSQRHQYIVLELAVMLRDFVKRNDLGRVVVAPFDIVLSDTNVLQPDVVFISHDRSRLLTDANMQGAPDVIFEVLSPSTAERDRTVKRTLYARLGVQELWFVDPQFETVQVLDLVSDDFETISTRHRNQTLTSPLLEGLSVDLSVIFPERSQT